MEVKDRLQRALQILDAAERVEVLSDIERDILLTELREAYAELRFGKTENGKRKTENETDVSEAQAVEPAVEESVEKSVAELPVVPIAPITPTEEEQDEEQEETEPEVEVELIFNEEEDEETENGEIAEPNEEVAEPNEEVAEPNEVVAEKNEEVAESSEEVAEDQNLSTLHSPLLTPKRSALLSLYEDTPTPVLGEQFHESPSVADTIACPKGVADSAPVASLREAIGLADKFMLIRELFDGNAEEYDNAIATLDKQPSFDDCIIYISENYTWSPSSAATKLVMELLERKYN